MQALYVVSDDSLSECLVDALFPYCHFTFGDKDKDDARLLAMLDDEAAVYRLEPELAGLPEVTRRQVLFGKAAEDNWSMSDVYLVMVQDGAVEWAAHY